MRSDCLRKFRRTNLPCRRSVETPCALQRRHAWQFLARADATLLRRAISEALQQWLRGCAQTEQPDHLLAFQAIARSQSFLQT